jgi:hypothetical protein
VGAVREWGSGVCVDCHASLLHVECPHQTSLTAGTQYSSSVTVTVMIVTVTVIEVVVIWVITVSVRMR